MTKDIPHVFSATRYAGFNDGMTWDPPLSEDELEVPLKRNLSLWENGDAFTFTIERKVDMTFIGRIVIRAGSDPERYNIGFWTHPLHQGKGYMTEAAFAVVDFGFKKLGARVIEATHAVWNSSSRRVLEKIGMVEMGYVAEGFKKGEVWVPEYRMEIKRVDE